MSDADLQIAQGDTEYFLSTEDESTMSEQDEERLDPVAVRKCIVFEDCLSELLHFCKDCGKPVIQKSKFEVGSSVGYKLLCLEGHNYIWHSQPIVNKLPIGNLLIAAAVLFSGSMYRRLEEFSRILNLSMFSKPVFNKMQKKQLLPVIQDTWKSSRDAAIAEVKKNAVIVVGGDGRSDSPGYTAKYGSYTLMHSDGVNIHATGKIVAMNLVQVSEVSCVKNILFIIFI